MKAANNFMQMNIDQIKESCHSVYNQKELIDLAEMQPEKFEGVINLYGVLSNIHRTRRCIQAEPRYGSRLVPEKVFIIDNLDISKNPNSISANLYITDKKGRLKNDFSEPDTDLKIKVRRSKNSNLKVIAFFGGSTIMGDGAQLPQFSIPALVEKILNLEYGIDCICINYGVLAWTIQDSFNLLTAEALKEKIDMVVFYSGWNCIRDFTIAEALKKTNPFTGKFRIMDGSSNRQIGFNHLLYNHYNTLINLKLTLSLFANQLASCGLRLLPIKSLQKYLIPVISKFFPVQQDFTEYIINSVQKNTITELSSGAVSHYRHINSMAKACSHKNACAYLSYFQPLLYFGKKNLSAEEKIIFELFNHYGEYYQEFYSLIKDNFIADEMIDLTGLFDSDFDQLYIDMGHLNKMGNFIVANKIAQDIAKMHA
jgi:hypothetical protein